MADQEATWSSNRGATGSIEYLFNVSYKSFTTIEMTWITCNRNAVTSQANIYWGALTATSLSCPLHFLSVWIPYGIMLPHRSVLVWSQASGLGEETQNCLWGYQLANGVLRWSPRVHHTLWGQEAQMSFYLSHIESLIFQKPVKSIHAYNPLGVTGSDQNAQHSLRSTCVCSWENSNLITFPLLGLHSPWSGDMFTNSASNTMSRRTPSSDASQGIGNVHFQILPNLRMI